MEVYFGRAGSITQASDVVFRCRFQISSLKVLETSSFGFHIQYVRVFFELADSRAAHRLVW